MAKLKDGTRVYGDATIEKTLTVGNITISGDLFVNGTTTAVNSTVTQIEDPIIELGGGANGAAAIADGKDRGLLMHYNNAGPLDSYMGWHATTSEFSFGDDVTELNGVVTINTYGNVRANHYYGEGDTLANITGDNVTGTVKNANNSSYAGIVTNPTQGNITSLGNLTGLQIGNAITTGNVVITTNGTISATGNITADYFNGNGSALTGVLADTAKQVANGTTTIAIPTADGNITMKVGSASNVVIITSTGANITGTANVSGNIDAGTDVNVTGQVTAANLRSNNLTATQVTFAGTSGLLQDSANFTFTSDSILTVPNIEASGTANIGTIKSTGLVSGKIAYISGSNTIVTDGQLSYNDQSDTLTTGNLEITTLANVASAKVMDLATGGIPYVGSGNTLATDLQLTYDAVGDKLSTGNLKLTGTANVKTAIVSDLTSGHVTFATTDGQLTDSSNLLFNSSTSTLTVDNAELSGTANIQTLKVADLTSTYVTFAGVNGTLSNDSNLTFASNKLNAPAIDVSGQVTAANLRSNSLVATQVTFAGLNGVLTNDSNLTFASNKLNAPAIDVSGQVTAANLRSNNLTSGQVTFSGTSGLLQDSANLTFDSGTKTLSTDNVTVSGTVDSKTLKSTDLTDTRIPFTNGSNTLTDSGNLSFSTSGNVLSVDSVTFVANVSGGNVVSANYVGGTLTTAAQPNVTSVGTLTSLTVSGNIVGQANIVTDNIIANGTGAITITGGSTNGSVVLAPQGTGVVDVSGARVSNIGTPTQSGDAATKGYVDANSQGLDVKQSVRAATTANIALDGSIMSVDSVSLSAGDRVLVKDQTNKAENGIYVADAGGWTRSEDANLTGEITGGSFTFVEEGTTYSDTGWVVSTNGTITIDTTNIEWTQFSGAGQYTAGDGLSLTGTTFAVNVDNTTIEISADNLKVKDSAQFVSPNIGAATGTSLDISGGNLTSDVVKSNSVSIQNFGNITGANVISGTTLTGTLSTASQPNITSVGTLGNLNVATTLDIATGAVVANAGGIFTDGYYYANGDAIDFQTAAGTDYEIQFHAYGVNDLDASSKLTFNPTTSNLTVNGNIITGTGSGGNITGANVVSATTLVASSLTQTYVTFAGTNGTLSNDSNLTFGSNKLNAPSIDVTGQVTAANLRSNNLTATQVTFAGTDGVLTNDGNLTFASNKLNAPAIDVTGGVLAANLTSNNLATANGIVVSQSGKLVNNTTLYVGANDTLTAANVATGGSITGANVTANNLSTTNGIVLSDANQKLVNNTTLYVGANDTLTAANLSIGGAGSFDSANVTANLTVGNISGANVISASYLTGTLTTASQPNVTSVGNLNGLTVNNASTVNFTDTANVTLGAIGNVHISGGTSGQVLRTDGTGSLNWYSIDVTQISNGNSNVSIPTANGNVILASAGNSVITVTGTGANVTGYVDVTGDINGDNLTAANAVVANGTVDATDAVTGTITTAGGISAQGNVYAGKAVGFAHGAGNTNSAAYIQFNATSGSLDFIFN